MILNQELQGTECTGTDQVQLVQMFLSLKHQAENPLTSPRFLGSVVAATSSATQTMASPKHPCSSNRIALFSQAANPPSAETEAKATLLRALTEADGRLPCPAAICFAGPMLRPSGEVVPTLTGIDQGVAQGWQIQSPDVGVGWGLRLLTVVS